MSNILITGCAGFIGSHATDCFLEQGHRVIGVDSLTYAGSLRNLSISMNNTRFTWYKNDICNTSDILNYCNTHNIDWIINFAAETHVDNSIRNIDPFLRSNIQGVASLLSVCRLTGANILHVSTDEVYGSVEKGSSIESSNIIPNSPYAASKSSADHLVFSFYKTYNFPAIIVRSSNNYGPYQFPEKLIPLIILNALENKNLPIYGNGKHIRNWIHVEDNVEALKKILIKGKIGNIYNVGGDKEINNIVLVKKICKILDKIKPRENKKKYESLIRFVIDRPGHDKRYSLNSNKIKKKFKWKPKIDIDTGLKLTINWYLNNKNWWEPIRKYKYKGERLGKNK